MLSTARAELAPAPLEEDEMSLLAAAALTLMRHQRSRIQKCTVTETKPTSTDDHGKR
jgi:hypothetical protein